jgi:LmbE family N-acetylglucosaminyl deacetylase
MNDNYINHPDHRAAGQIAIDAVFPAAGNPLFFTELITEEQLYPHGVEEVWLSLPKEPNLVLDVTATWDKKIAALLQHRSQIGKPDAFTLRMKSRKTEDSSEDAPRYQEEFKRIIFK